MWARRLLAADKFFYLLKVASICTLWNLELHQVWHVSVYFSVVTDPWGPYVLMHSVVHIASGFDSVRLENNIQLC